MSAVTTEQADTAAADSKPTQGEMNVFWGDFESDFETCFEILRSVNHVADEGTDFHCVHGVVHDWVNALAGEIASRSMQKADVVQLQEDLPKLSALLGACMANRQGAAFKHKLREARAMLESFRPRADDAFAKGYYVPRPPAPKQPEPPEFLYGYSSEQVEQVLSEIATASEAARRYIVGTADDKADLTIVRSMVTQIGSLADHLLAPEVVGSPVDWVVETLVKEVAA